MYWLLLIVAGVLEVSWTVTMKWSGHFTQPRHTMATVILSILSVYFLDLATSYPDTTSNREKSLANAYAVWTGFGAIGAFAAGILLFGDEFAWRRLLFVILIVAGIVGLESTAQEKSTEQASLADPSREVGSPSTQNLPE